MLPFKTNSDLQFDLGEWLTKNELRFRNKGVDKYLTAKISE